LAARMVIGMAGGAESHILPRLALAELL